MKLINEAITQRALYVGIMLQYSLEQRNDLIPTKFLHFYNVMCLLGMLRITFEKSLDIYDLVNILKVVGGNETLRRHLQERLGLERDLNTEEKEAMSQLMAELDTKRQHQVAALADTLDAKLQSMSRLKIIKF